MQPGHRDRDFEVLKVSLSRLSEASLRINESLDFDTVTEVDPARAAIPCIGQLEPTIGQKNRTSRKGTNVGVWAQIGRIRRRALRLCSSARHPPARPSAHLPPARAFIRGVSVVTSCGLSVLRQLAFTVTELCYFLPASFMASV